MEHNWELKIKMQTHGQLIFDKRARNTQWENKYLFNKHCLENWIFTCKRMKSDLYLTPLPQINSKWIKDLNLRPKTIKTLKGNIRGKLLDIGSGNDFFFLYYIQNTSNKSNYQQCRLYQIRKLLCNKRKKSIKWKDNKLTANIILNGEKLEEFLL